MNAVLTVERAGKAYRRYPSRWARLCEWLTGKANHELNWVFRDVSFSLGAGESLGIVGRNGAGKTTLLRLIAGITQPTTGSVSTSGRVAALLELGMGFHPDFDGRENAIIGCQLLGMSAQEIEACLPEIEAFAEIGDYFRRPVRQYSSGMQMRLAFAVATAMRPDLLIVDEAMAVGDAYFQHKSMERIRRYQEQGMALLLVSHDPGAILSLCPRAILIDEGRVACDGNAETVLDRYNASLSIAGRENIRSEPLADGRESTISGSGEARVERVRLFNSDGVECDVVSTGDTLRLAVDVAIQEAIDDLVLGYMIKDRLGRSIFGTNTHHLKLPMRDLKPGQRVGLNFTFQALLGPDSYSIATSLHTGDTHHAANYEWRDLALLFQVVNSAQTHFVGACWMPPVATLDGDASTCA
ncbi:MAG: ABC transporter ATP-binding protein [Lysobacteraceae bacterium]